MYGSRFPRCDHRNSRRCARPAGPLARTPPHDRFSAHRHRRRYPARASVFPPGDPASGRCITWWQRLVSIISPRREDGPVLAAGLLPAPASSSARWACSSNRPARVQLRTAARQAGRNRLRNACTSCSPARSPAMPPAWYAIGAWLSRRLLDTQPQGRPPCSSTSTDRIERTPATSRRTEAMMPSVGHP